MKYEVTRRGVYDAKGEMIEIGTEIEVRGDTVPGYLVGKSVPVKGGKVAVTNPAQNPQPGESHPPVGPFEAKEKSPGWFAIHDGSGDEVGKAVRKDDADAFNTLSDDDKAAFAAEHAKA